MTAVSGLALNIGSGGFPAAAPWINVDVSAREGTEPDVLVVAGEPLPFGDGAADAVYLGHVLEHVPWDEVPALLADLRRVLAPGGRLCVVGPDYGRTLHRWKAGDEPWELVLAVLESDEDQADLGADAHTGARHQWNCTERRIVVALEHAGFVDVLPLGLDAEALSGWPVVSFAPWQCAVKAAAP